MRSLGKRHRMPPVLRRRAIDALLQGMCFHYDPLANRVQRSITNLAIEIGCNIPTDITFTPALFSAFDVSDVAVAAARRSRVEWENQQRKKQSLMPLEMDELIARAWRFIRERFRSYQSERKLHGLKRARARRDADRTRKDIEILVKQQLTREYACGRFTGGLKAMKREIERRVKERMLMSRDNYTRLSTVPI